MPDGGRGSAANNGRPGFQHRTDPTVCLLARARIPMAAASGVAGILVGAATLLGFFSGHLRLDVHGAIVLYTLQAAWTAWLGVTMCLKGKHEAV